MAARYLLPRCIVSFKKLCFYRRMINKFLFEKHVWQKFLQTILSIIICSSLQSEATAFTRWLAKMSYLYWSWTNVLFTVLKNKRIKDLTQKHITVFVGLHTQCLIKQLSSSSVDWHLLPPWRPSQENSALQILWSLPWQSMPCFMC